MEPSDDDLIGASAAGDREAFAALYRKRRPDVYRFALHMMGSASAAEDVVQDVFLVVIHEARRYQAGRSGVVPWLLGIARNYVRRRGAQRPSEPLDDGLHERLMVVADQHEALERDRRLVELRRALLALPSVYREAVVLCDLEELSYADAADSVGCAVGTIRSRLHRGRALLTAKLRGQADSATWPAPKWMV